MAPCDGPPPPRFARGRRRLTTLPERLARRERIPEPVALVVAHPDDETLALGALLPLFDRLTLAHLTDGAPRDARDARAAGLPDAPAYAAARARELDVALGRLGIRVARVALDLPDQEAARNLPALAARLTLLLATQTAVITHAYEGGHPDHDSAAFAVAAARCTLGDLAPAAFEFAGYHAHGLTERWHAFWPDPDAAETALPLTPREQARLAAALACFASQAATLNGRAPTTHRLRPAARYDFGAPPPSGTCLYERWGFPITGADWRWLAACA